MSDTPANINGALLRLKREERGWLVSDMATRACMSIKQIRQLEEGGASSFYSESVKLTSAKKVGAILGLTADEVFGLPAQDLRTSHEPQDEASTESVSTVSSDGGNDATHDSVQPETVSAQQGASTLPQSSDDITASSASASASAPQDLVASTERAVETEAEKKGKTPFVAMLALFVAALAIAAWMRPEAEPVAVEPPPPLQNIPAEGADAPASAASSEMETPASVASTTAASAALSSASPTAAASASPASLPVAPAAPTAPKAATATTVPATPATPATQAQLATPSAVPPAAKSSAAAAPASVPASKPQ